MYPKKDDNGCLIFIDHPEFKPNVTPKEMFAAGIMDGTYFRPIHSGVTGKEYKNMHKKYKFLNSIPESKLTLPIDSANVGGNKYKVHVGTTLEFWESKNWIKESHPYGWIQWYCDFYTGKRSDDDGRQIKRWLGIAGPTGRFKKNLLRQIKTSGAKYDDPTISPRIRQTLLHWGFELVSSSS